MQATGDTNVWPSGQYRPGLGVHTPEQSGVERRAVNPYKPAAQGKHVTDPAPTEYDPGGHEEHTVAWETLKVPGGHRPLHRDDESAEVFPYVPAGQDVHPAVVMSLYCPAGHGRELDDEPLQ